jgi:hypothetical protein
VLSDRVKNSALPSKPAGQREAMGDIFDINNLEFGI